ncbi:MAG: hypothetical protein BAJALOKI1v1_800013 [Promethearchaeota archaeon]|nr:MAG: hypothetical protein BAJALOKI1v1_800013 [Candidatus Lokiarchaeota archaeon]
MRKQLRASSVIRKASQGFREPHAFVYRDIRDSADLIEVKKVIIGIQIEQKHEGNSFQRVDGEVAALNCVICFKNTRGN